MKLLTIGMMILRDHVIDRLGARSVRAAMADCWEPSGAKCILENQENAFYEADISPTAENAYRQVFMAALRNFPRLSVNAPRRERGQKVLTAAIDNVHLASFLRGVQRQGFRSQKVTASLKRLRTCPTPQFLANCEAPFPESALHRRCGRPFARSYSVLRESFYLPNILIGRDSSQICTLFVQEDFICLFRCFGQHSVAVQSLAQCFATSKKRLSDTKQTAYLTTGDRLKLHSESSLTCASPCVTTSYRGQLDNGRQHNRGGFGK